MTAIVVLGAGLRGTSPSPVLARRLDSAISLWNRRGKKDVLILSGGQGPDEKISEAAAMAKYAVARGVHPAFLILEAKYAVARGVHPAFLILGAESTSTEENLRFSSALLPTADKKIFLVTSTFHLPRALAWARAVGLDATGVGASAPPLSFVKWTLREVAALIITLPKILRAQPNFPIRPD